MPHIEDHLHPRRMTPQRFERRPILWRHDMGGNGDRSRFPGAAAPARSPSVGRPRHP
jgi:hypothetical protein